MTVTEVLALVDKFDWASYNEDLKGEFADIFGNIVVSQGERGAARAGLDVFNAEDPFVQRRLTAYVGDRITQLDETTRDNVSDLIRTMLEDDAGIGSVGELGDRIAENVRERFDGFADYRADRIARSETAIAYNYGNILGYRQAGVEEVVVSDGDGDPECAAADGQVWPLAKALENPIAHPNCERDFSPKVAA